MTRYLGRRITSLGLLALLTVALGGCASGTASAFVGEWGDEGGSGQPFLELTAQGDVLGSDGCNRLVGTWSEDGDVARLDQLASTLMACPDVDAWLAGAHSARIVDGELAVSDQSGTELGTLERAPAEESMTPALRIFLDVVLIAAIALIAGFGSMIVVRSVHEEGVHKGRSLRTRFVTATLAGLVIIALAVAVVFVSIA